MKTLTLYFTIVTLLLATSRGEDKRLDLGTGDDLLITTDPALEISATPAAPDRVATIVLKDRQRICEIRMMFAIPPQKVMSEDALKDQIQASGQRMLSNSVEGKLNIQKLPNPTFDLLYFELTDKREDSGEGRFMLQGLGSSGKYICQFMMLTKEKTSDAKATILKALGTMKIVSHP